MIVGLKLLLLGTHDPHDARQNQVDVLDVDGLVQESIQVVRTALLLLFLLLVVRLHAIPILESVLFVFRCLTEVNSRILRRRLDSLICCLETVPLLAVSQNFSEVLVDEGLVEPDAAFEEAGNQENRFECFEQRVLMSFL